MKPAVRRRRRELGKIATLVPHELRDIDESAYSKARSAPNVESALRIVRRYEKQLSFRGAYVPRVEVDGRDRMNFLQTTGQYTRDKSDPRDFSRREPVETGHVEEFSPDAVPPPRTPDMLDVEPGVALPITASREWLGLPFNARPTREL